VPPPLRVGLISVGVVLSLTWLVWTALLHSRPVVAAEVVMLRIDSNTSVSATIAVDRRDPSVPVTCRGLAQAAVCGPFGPRGALKCHTHPAATSHGCSGPRLHRELTWFGVPLIALGDV